MRGESTDRRGIKEDLDSDDFLLEFVDISDQFQQGFECGEIWACLTDGVKELTSIVSAGNAEMIMRMAEATGYTFEAVEITDAARTEFDLGPGEWIMVTMVRGEDDSGTE
jgi:hypothetical protein